jgi:nucleotidyltransferase AbiEii toxin of type IV toxin-antitoxin system
MNGINWEKSKALTPLKKDFLKEFFAIENRFFLTGGSALGIFYFDHRYSYDLDFFTTDDNIDWKFFELNLRSICKKIQAQLEPVTKAPSFQRFQLKRGMEHEILDFVIEWVKQIDSQKNNIGGIQVDTLREIGTNKICTLLGRSEVKDVLDLYFLSKNGFDIVSNIDAAMKKDGGLDPATLSYIVSTVKIKELPDYLIEDVSLDDLNKFITKLKNDLAKIAFPK